MTTEKNWSKDASGKLVMPQIQSDFLDWLLSDEKVPRTEQDWCTRFGVARGTTKKWKQDRRFKEVWERRAVEKNVSPERMHKVMDVLYNSAVGQGDVAAAKQYLLHTEKYLPPREIKRDASLSHMTDAELLEEMQAIVDAGFGDGR